MEIYQVAFIGHREVYEHRQVADELDTVLSMLLKKHEYIEFYVGKNGEFDELAASAVRRLTSEWSAFCSLALVLPYEIANLDLIEKSYDEVIMPNDYKCHYNNVRISRKLKGMSPVQYIFINSKIIGDFLGR